MIRKIQIKTTKTDFTLILLAKFKKFDNIVLIRVCRNRQLRRCWWEQKFIKIHRRKVGQYLSKFQMSICEMPSNPFLSLHLQECLLHIVYDSKVLETTPVSVNN